jgi:hypothetical protein
MALDVGRRLDLHRKLLSTAVLFVIEHTRKGLCPLNILGVNACLEQQLLGQHV